MLCAFSTPDILSDISDIPTHAFFPSAHSPKETFRWMQYSSRYFLDTYEMEVKQQAIGRHPQIATNELNICCISLTSSANSETSGAYVYYEFKEQPHAATKRMNL